MNFIILRNIIQAARNASYVRNANRWVISRVYPINVMYIKTLCRYPREVVEILKFNAILIHGLN